jgi:predicted acyl esterase
MKKQCLFLFLFPIILFGQNEAVTLEKLKEIAVVDQKVMMPMRDGIRLASDIYRPKSPGKYPIKWVEMLGKIFHRLIYKHRTHVLNSLPPLTFKNYR